MKTLQRDGHPEDGDLVRLIDSEVGLAERQPLYAHLHECTVCTTRLEQLRRRLAQLSGLLIATDIARPANASPPARPIRALGRTRPTLVVLPWMRAAAVIVVLIGAAALVSPVRAWVAQWVRQWTEQSAPQARAPQTSAPEQVIPERSTRVAFTPTDDVLLLEFASSQAAGAVQFQPGSGSEASVEVLRSASDVDLLVLPGGVRVNNTQAAGADYHVVVPSAVQLVRVRIGDRRSVTVSLGDVQAGRRLSLGPQGG